MVSWSCLKLQELTGKLKKSEKKGFDVTSVGIEPETYRREGIAQKATHKPIMVDYDKVRLFCNLLQNELNSDVARLPACYRLWKNVAESKE